MPDSVRRAPKVVPLDADKLGHVAAAWGALAVAVMQMFVRDATLLTTLVRSGWTYIGVYAAIYILVRMFLRASLFQMLADRRERREARRRQMRARQEEAKAQGLIIPEETTPPPPLAEGETPTLTESGLPRL